MTLRELDDRLLPVVAGALQRFADRLHRTTPGAAPAPAAPRPQRQPAPARPAGPAPVIVRLRRIDDRLARRGPLGLVREVPQLGALVLAIVVLVSGATVFQRALRDRDDPGAGNGELPGDSDAVLTIGPTIGEQVTEYATTVRNRLVEFAAGQPDGESYAVISFKVYRNLTDAAKVAAGYDVVQVFYRVRTVDAAPIRSAEVTDVGALPAEWDQVAEELRNEADHMRRFAATITNDPDQKQQQLTDATRLIEEAGTLTSAECRCVFGIVVRAKLRRLVDLAARTGVRLVDPAPPRTGPAGLSFRPLLPEERITVTEGNEAPGPD